MCGCVCVCGWVGGWVWEKENFLQFTMQNAAKSGTKNAIDTVIRPPPNSLSRQSGFARFSLSRGDLYSEPHTVYQKTKHSNVNGIQR
jgi:hypothetical protein